MGVWGPYTGPQRRSGAARMFEGQRLGGVRGSPRALPPPQGELARKGVAQKLVYKNPFQALAVILQNEGPQAFGKGLLPAYGAQQGSRAGRSGAADAGASARVKPFFAESAAFWCAGCGRSTRRRGGSARLACTRSEPELG